VKTVDQRAFNPHVSGKMGVVVLEGNEFMILHLVEKNERK
jgi:hypothetical protein